MAHVMVVPSEEQVPVSNDPPRNTDRARDNDPRLRAIVRDHLDFTWRSLRRLGLPASLADDAVQRVFLVASDRIEDIRPGCERAFLFNTALRVASSEKRAFARRREVFDERVGERVRDTTAGAEEQLDRHQARAVLEEILMELDLDLRAVFVLFELEELSTAEIATTLEIPIGTAASRLRRAREEFQGAAKRYQAQAHRVERGQR